MFKIFQPRCRASQKLTRRGGYGGYQPPDPIEPRTLVKSGGGGGGELAGPKNTPQSRPPPISQCAMLTDLVLSPGSPAPWPTSPVSGGSDGAASGWPAAWNTGTTAWNVTHYPRSGGSNCRGTCSRNQDELQHWMPMTACWKRGGRIGDILGGRREEQGRTHGGLETYMDRG